MSNLPQTRRHAPLYPIPLVLNDGTRTDFSQFKGKVVLVVNVASNCGFTPQYAGLEALYEKFRDRGFEVLGVPCNQFAGQEPGTDRDIAEFCERNFGVTFPLTAKADVRGRNQHPLYTELTKFKTGLLPGLVKWNFEKFLVNRDGEVVARFAPTVEPDSAEVIDAVEQELG
ncbi:glutathione peroxidase [Arthrobacter sp. FX8]|jgi:glutathione peroxidase|uniref:glutathione peroxidase n=1 Tax=Micrococcaceae TaxID=1268 RepID=UPI000378B355|nr:MULTISPECIES: glutathione peroxidase [unclassified Arthrobacter]KRE66891.1 glutathione peroxidase [Arthrobacter sp. Soil761]TWD48785.1 glutathione peroxidase [Arthrobacter sp. AG367]WAJ33421.1 glutathione peroxidase [Arthrobacter sp. FX8]BCW53200.1 glutathione peroxidase [Arthrobacter sp. StoSoilB19]BCW74285.1 glutathione peroxidase [Arthrobacter sp. NicSoilB11]